MLFRRSLLCIAVMAATTASLQAAEESRYTSSDINRDHRKTDLSRDPDGRRVSNELSQSGVVDGSGGGARPWPLCQADDTGKWWIDGDRLCQRFTTWYKGTPMCFELYKTGASNLKWIRNNVQVGTARIGQSL